MDYLELALMIIGALVVFASTVVAALEKAASITPDTKDDERVAKFKKWLGLVSFVFDKVSVINLGRSKGK